MQKGTPFGRSLPLQPTIQSTPTNTHAILNQVALMKETYKQGI